MIPLENYYTFFLHPTLSIWSKLKKLKIQTTYQPNNGILKRSFIQYHNSLSKLYIDCQIDNYPPEAVWCLIKCFHFVSLHPSKIAFLLLSIFYKSFPSSQSQLTKVHKVVFTPLLSTQPKACPLFKAFSSTCQPLPLKCPPHHKKKEIDSQTTPPNPPPARRPKPLHLQSYTIYILYFVVIAQKFQRFRVNTYNLFDLSF